MSYNLRFYAVRTAARREERVAKDILQTAGRLDIDVGQVLFHPKTAGYVYVECAGVKDLERMLSMVPSSKGIVGEISAGDVEKLFEVKEDENPLVEYVNVVISQGSEKGSEGTIESIAGVDAVVMLDDPIMPRRVSVPLSWLKRKES